jgi:hypothetical protein
MYPDFNEVKRRIRERLWSIPTVKEEREPKCEFCDEYPTWFAMPMGSPVFACDKHKPNKDWMKWEK